jgi:Uma2 family endonuclease
VGDAELHSRAEAEHIMGMPASAPHRWTEEEVDRIIEERDGYTPRYELVDGELLVTPAPNVRHQRIALRLALLLHEWLMRNPVGEVRLGPSALGLMAGAHFEPDVFVVPAPDGRLPPPGPVPDPLLVCEVLSPGSARHDRLTKRRAFQAQGVPEYWVVDGDAEAFEVWHPGDERATLADERITWTPPGVQEPFELDVREFFASIAAGAPIGRSDL